MSDEIDAIMTEVTKIRETADRMANGEHPDEADEVRLLAGMVRQLADQFQRLGNLSGASPQASAADVSTEPQIDNQPAVDRDGRLVTRMESHRWKAMSSTPSRM